MLNTLESLRLAADELTDNLEQELLHSSFTSLLGKNLQLRYSQCAMASATLKNLLSIKQGIDTVLLKGVSPNTPRWPDGYQMTHVLLRHHDVIIDSTFSQFYSYVGLDAPAASTNRNLLRLYPPEKIAVVHVDETDSFAQTIATNALRIRRSVAELDLDSIYCAPDNSLAHVSEDELRSVYQAIWDPQHFYQYS